MLLPVIGVLSFFTIFLVYTKLAGPIPFSVNSVTTKSTTFDVTGEGKVNVSPDIANVSAGIRAQAQTVKAAQGQINTVVSKVTDAIKGLGIEAKDIKTANYNINPDIDYSTGSQKVVGYTATTTLSIKVRDLDKVNGVIDAATAAGANEINGIGFDVDDKSKAENEAREKAVADARQKAEDAAKIAGFKLGRIINYSENFGGYPGPVPFRMSAEVVKDAATPTQVEPGSSEIVVNVTLSFEIN